MNVPMIFIAEDDQSKEKTEEYFQLAESKNKSFKKIEKQIILAQEENAIVPNKHEDVEIMRTFLYKGTGNPPGMEDNMDGYNDRYHWYVPSRVGYQNC